MDIVEPVDPEDLSPTLREMYDATPRAGLKGFVQVMAHAERFHVEFSKLYASVRFENHLGHKLTELVRITSPTRPVARCAWPVASPPPSRRA